ncbi:Retrotransposon gag domain [Dillenia turbinata]|uniref:Retrotransposon gag domain n=1 Tax=Dillenia turbinata TaxID=194707 RepID=A0AAN8W3S1_9MAGN
MSTNKEIIENLEAGLGELQQGMSRLELGLANKLHHMEETLTRLSEALLSNKEGFNNNNNDRNSHLRHNRAEFKDNVEGELFEEELWARFGSTNCEDFDEALSKIKQIGSLRDYEKEFERLGNWVQGWTQKALVGTFMGGLNTEIVNGWSFYRTMRVIARIEHNEMVVLIDSGSTNNFISKRMTNLLQLLVIPTKPFNVKVANGKPLRCQGRFENVQVMLQGIPFILTLYAIPLIGLDLVLRVHWLEQLGTTICN